MEEKKSGRVIKFRAWDKECGNWIYAEPLYGFFPSVHGLDKSEAEYAASDHYGEVQMYTGLHDKNGKEIYEGDILKRGGGEGIRVAWHNETSSFVFIDSNGVENWINTKTTRDQNILVIGNVYENPELLTV